MNREPGRHPLVRAYILRVVGFLGDADPRGREIAVESIEEAVRDGLAEAGPEPTNDQIAAILTEMGQPRQCATAVAGRQLSIWARRWVPCSYVALSLAAVALIAWNTGPLWPIGWIILGASVTAVAASPLWRAIERVVAVPVAFATAVAAYLAVAGAAATGLSSPGEVRVATLAGIGALSGVASVLALGIVGLRRTLPPG